MCHWKSSSSSLRLRLVRESEGLAIFKKIEQYFLSEIQSDSTCAAVTESIFMEIYQFFHRKRYMSFDIF